MKKGSPFSSTMEMSFVPRPELRMNQGRRSVLFHRAWHELILNEEGRNAGGGWASCVPVFLIVEGERPGVVLWFWL
jgi:hypothetical protein